jgi:RNA polymerase-binding transcription factor DksA
MATSTKKKPAPKKPAPKKAAPKKPAPKKAAPKKPAPKKAAPKKPAPKKAVPKKPAPKKAAPKKPAPKKTVAPKKPAPKKTVVAAKPVAPKKTVVPAKAVAPKKAAVAPAPKPPKAPPKPPAPKPFVKPPVPGKRPISKDGIVSNKDFDLAFLRAQRQLLVAKRAEYLGQAEQLEFERNLLIEAAGMGDDQFDEEGGDGDTLAVERERAKVLSDQDRQIVIEIDAALARIESGDYGYSVVSTKPIPRERLEAIPWATELVAERVGGIR